MALPGQTAHSFRQAGPPIQGACHATANRQDCIHTATVLYGTKRTPAKLRPVLHATVIPDTRIPGTPDGKIACGCAGMRRSGWGGSNGRPNQAQMTFLGSSGKVTMGGDDSAVLSTSVLLPATLDVEVDARGILFTYGSTYLL